jgi:hypothetical protein
MPIIKSGYAKHRRRHTTTYERNRRLVLAYATRCAICAKRFNPHDIVECDHIVPVADGGNDEVSNLRAVHRCCNRQRGRGSTGGAPPSSRTPGGR